MELSIQIVLRKGKGEMSRGHGHLQGYVFYVLCKVCDLRQYMVAWERILLLIYYD